MQPWAVEGLKYREIADVLGVLLGAVVSRLYRDRAVLGSQLTDPAAEHGISVPEMKVEKSKGQRESP